MRITEDEQDERRNRMIHTAYILFCEQGIDYVTIERLAKAVGFSRNSIFRYFGNKADLVECTQVILWQEITAHILQNSELQLNSAKTGWEKVRILLFGFKDLYEKHSKYLLFACDYKLFLVRTHTVLSEYQHNKIMNPIYLAFIDALKSGQADGSINRSQTVETQFFTIWGVLRGFMEQIVVYDQMYGGKNPWKDYLDFVLAQIMEAIKEKNLTS